MRRAVAATALGLSAIAAPAWAGGGEMYMGLTAGPSSAGHTRDFDTYFDDHGHAAVGFVLGGETRGVTFDLVFGGTGYTVRGLVAPADTDLLWFGADLGRRIWLSHDLALGATVGLHAAQMLPWSDKDRIPDKLRVGGAGWSVGAHIEYVLGRLAPGPAYHGAMKALNASLVVDARREQLVLSSDPGLRTEPTIMLVTAGLRFGIQL